MKKTKLVLVFTLIAIITAVGVTCYYNQSQDKTIVEATLI